MRLNIDVNLEDLADAIEPEDAFDVVKGIDARMGDYKWTLGLVRYLVGELIKCCEFDGEAFDVNSILPRTTGESHGQR